MTQEKSFLTFYKKNFVLILILLLAACTRLIGLGSLPDGVYPDEAYGAYNAYAIMTEGIDSWGYSFPVYYIAWGSGQSVLNSYLAIPFFLLFGVNIFAYRLPQALLGIADVYAAYVLGRELSDRRFGLLFSFVLAINPWHIMNTRFNLDANMAPLLFLIALCFLVLGIRKNSRYLMLSALFFGLTLYCYVLSWIVVPLFLALVVLLYHRIIPRDRYTVVSFFILFLLAFPLLLFVGVNMFGLPEITIPPFGVSIPRLYGVRADELGITAVKENLAALLKEIFNQFSFAEHSLESPLTGIYYCFTAPFIIVGLFYHILLLFRRGSGEEDASRLSLMMLLWTISAAVMIALNQHISVIHINLIHLPFLFYSAYGVYLTAQKCSSRRLLPACLIFWSFSFLVFLYADITTPSTYFFGSDIEEALEAAKTAAGTDGRVSIYLSDTYKFSNLMWHEKFSPTDFSQNAVYGDFGPWMDMVSYAGFYYVNAAENITEDSVYLFNSRQRELFIERGFQVSAVNPSYCLAIPRAPYQDSP